MLWERPSPQNIVPESSIQIISDDNPKVEIDLTRLNIPFTRPPVVWIPSVPNTNSMDPVFDEGNNCILIRGADEENQRILVDFIKVGDIVVWAESETKLVIHRVVKIGRDSKGRFFRFKGDNCWFQDPWIIRDSDIRWLSVGVIY